VVVRADFGVPIDTRVPDFLTVEEAGAVLRFSRGKAYELAWRVSRHRRRERGAGHPAGPTVACTTRSVREVDRRLDHMANPNDTHDRAGRDRVSSRVDAVQVARDSSTCPPLASRRSAVELIPRLG